MTRLSVNAALGAHGGAQCTLKLVPELVHSALSISSKLYENGKHEGENKYEHLAVTGFVVEFARCDTLQDAALKDCS